jgi:hypothetical protein
MNPTVQLEDEKPGSVLPYLCWAGALVLGFYNLVYFREVAIAGLLVLELDKKLFLLLDKTILFFFAAIGLLVILLTEPYFRMGYRKGVLAARFLRVLSFGFAAQVILWAILLALPGLSDGVRPSLGAFYLFTALLVAAATLCRRMNSQTPIAPE